MYFKFQWDTLDFLCFRIPQLFVFFFTVCTVYTVCIFPVCTALISETHNPEISRISTEHAYKYKTKLQVKMKWREKKRKYFLNFFLSDYVILFCYFAISVIATFSNLIIELWLIVLRYAHVNLFVLIVFVQASISKSISFYLSIRECFYFFFYN